MQSAENGQTQLSSAFSRLIHVSIVWEETSQVCAEYRKAIKIRLETSEVYTVCGKGPNPTEQCFSYGGHAVTFWHFHVPFRGSKSCKTALPLTESQITSTPRCALSPHINQPGFTLKMSGYSNTTKYSILIHCRKNISCEHWYSLWILNFTQCLFVCL